MAIPSMPQGFNVSQANGEILTQWDISAGATTYSVQRSLDGVTFTQVATPATTSYLDTSVTVGTEYYYKVAAVNGSGTSVYTTPQKEIPAPTGEMSLYGIRKQAQQRADRVNSNFVTLPEWNVYINQAMMELYDLLVTNYEDYFTAIPVEFISDGSTYRYPLPDGRTTYINGINGQSGYVAPSFYKLQGVDLAVQSSNQAWVTVQKFNFIDRNKYVYPNSASTIYGVFNLQYRLMGNSIQFIPTPSANQPIRLWYIPRVTELLQDTDITTIGFSGWMEYVIVRAAKYALDKEESDTSKLDSQILYLKGRIEEAGQNRDAGRPDTISDVRGSGWWGGTGGGPTGPVGGF